MPGQEMMKYAIIADIHANLEAFQVVLQDIEKQKCTNVACLGDVVGYNANPKECLDTVRAMNIPCVKGNHDEFCSSDTPMEGFSPNAAEAGTGRGKKLTEDDRKLAAGIEISQAGVQFHHRPRHPGRAAAVGIRV